MAFYLGSLTSGLFSGLESSVNILNGIQNYKMNREDYNAAKQLRDELANAGKVNKTADTNNTATSGAGTPTPTGNAPVAPTDLNKVSVQPKGYQGVQPTFASFTPPTVVAPGRSSQSTFAPIDPSRPGAPAQGIPTMGGTPPLPGYEMPPGVIGPPSYGGSAATPAAPEAIPTTPAAPAAPAAPAPRQLPIGGMRAAPAAPARYLPNQVVPQQTTQANPGIPAPGGLPTLAYGQPGIGALLAGALSRGNA